MPRKLKVVTEADTPPAPKSLTDAVEMSERALLAMMRSKIASEIDSGVPPHTLAPLSRQLRDIDKEIRVLDLRAKQEADDDSVSPDERWDDEAL